MTVASMWLLGDISYKFPPPHRVLSVLWGAPLIRAQHGGGGGGFGGTGRNGDTPTVLWDLALGSPSPGMGWECTEGRDSPV